MLINENRNKETVNQRVLGSSPRGGANKELHENVALFCFY